VGMGILPLQHQPGQNADSLGLTGAETFDILGIAGGALKPKSTLVARATDGNGRETTFEVTSRVDTPVEVEYYMNGGILQTVLRAIASTPAR